LVRQPDVFLFDEPLSNLDAQLRAEMRRELKQLGRRLATTIIYVTHDQVEALTLGDRIAVLDRGQLQQLGTPAEVYDRPANRFVAGFIGSPPMNLVEGGWNEDAEGRVRFVGEGWSARLDERRLNEPGREGLAGRRVRRAVLGLRPEHLRLAGAAEAESPTEWQPARVTSVELLGDSITVELLPAGGGEQRPLLCKTGAEAAWSVGDQVQVGFDMRRAHWFDALTGENLCRPGGVRG
jgi:ABC-type sugar transport system ATPase subunit